jgi:SAM-dependent methyltransferase
MAQQKQTWVAGDRYEPYMGRWSRQVAPGFLDWLQVPPGSKWLDIGCGTGALAAAILDRAQPASVLGIDPSAGFVEHARAHVADARASFEIGDAQQLPVESQRFDAVVSALVLNFVAKPELAAGEMARAARTGGTVAAYVWDYAGKMDLMRRFWEAAVELDPAAAAFDEGRRPVQLCQPAPLEALFVQAGLRGVEVQRSISRHPFATSTTTGHPSSADRDPRPATRCP